MSFGGFVRRALAVTSIVLIVFGVITLLWFTSYVWLALLVGILLALFLRGLSNWVERRLRIAHPWALILVLVALVGVLVLASWLLVSPISKQFQQLQEQLPQAVERLWQRIQASPLSQYLPSTQASSIDAMSLSKSLAPMLASVFEVSVAAAAGVLMAVFTALYMAFDPRTYVAGILRLVPIPRRSRAREILHETDRVLTSWIYGQIVSMSCVGTLIGFGLYLSGIPLSLALGIIAGVLDIIPIIGPILASIPAILLGFTVGPWHALFAIVVFVGANQLETHVLLPVIHRYTVWLPPALTLFALMIMTTMFGILGTLLATPITAIALVLVKRLYVEDTLGDAVGEAA